MTDMKFDITIIIFLLFSINLRAQKTNKIVYYDTEFVSFVYANSNVYKVLPTKGLYPPIYFLARDSVNYYLFITVSESYKYPAIDENNSEYAYLTSDDGKQVVLKRYEDRVIRRWPFCKSVNVLSCGPNNEYSGPQRVDCYKTEVIYRIDDIDDFMSHTYTGLNFFNGLVAIDMNKENPKFIKKFNKSLKSAKKWLEKDYKDNYLSLLKAVEKWKDKSI